MATIGDWVWHKNEFGDKFIGQITGFEPDGRVLIFLYPSNPGGTGKTVYDNLDRLYILTQEEKSYMAIKDSYTDGYELGKALREVFGTSVDYNVNPQSVFSLGRKFATMTGYGNLDEGFRFIEGFVVAFQQSAPKQIAAEKGE